MKYVKRLWERSAYLAERGFDLDWHASMLEALQPLLSHWSAELCQIAAHVETLVKMMKCGNKDMIEHACGDFPTLRNPAAADNFLRTPSFLAHANHVLAHAFKRVML